MKLYFAPGACSLSPHIVLEEAGLRYQAEAVDIRAKRTASGADYMGIHPRGQVPALELDDGEVLTEGPVIVQYLADLVPEKRLIPPAGTRERYRVQIWLNFIGTELHKSFGAHFNPGASADWKAAATANIQRRLAFIEGELAGRRYLTGEDFTVADAYFFVMLAWCRHLSLDLSPYPSTMAYQGRVAQRPAVLAALKAEGLG